MFSSIVKRLAVPIRVSWNTRDTRPARLLAVRLVTSLSSILIAPWSTNSEPAMAFRKVDFPAPLPPIIVMKSPFSTFRSTPFNTWFSFGVLASNVLCTFCNVNTLVIGQSPFYASLLVIEFFTTFLPC